MKILILGMNGMVGHKLCQVMSPSHEVYGTTRKAYGTSIERYQCEIINSIDAHDVFPLTRVMKGIKPNVVVNCIGVVKSRIKESDTAECISVNALFPHRLREICSLSNSRLIHISTDCVFSGKKGGYKESDIADADDLYGRSKCLGEVTGKDVLTIRTSLIGRELGKGHNLVEWILLNKGNRIQGYSKAIFSGFPTLHFSQVVKDIIEKYQYLNGIRHISANPISKYALVKLINEGVGLGIDIERVDKPVSDRSLNSNPFRILTGFQPKSWEIMIKEFVEDAKQYEE